MKTEPTQIAKIRTALADYIASEGCDCCRDKQGHDDALFTLGKLLKMKKYSDGSGVDYSRYKSKK